MQQNDPLPTLEISALSHEGRGIARDPQGKTIFVDGALPGEQVAYQLVKKKRRFNIAKALEIYIPAADRVTPPCEHFMGCGGCALQHLSTEAQLRNKQASLLEQLQHFGNVQPQQVLPPLVGPTVGYRTKARLGVRYVHKKDQVLVGFREKHSNYLAELNSCQVLHPQIGNLIAALKEFIRARDGYADIAQLEVAVGTDHLAMIVRNMRELSAADLQAWIAFAKARDFDFYLQPAGPDSVHKVWPQDHNPRLYYHLPEYNLRFAFHPTDFTQVNTTINDQMLAQALQLLQVNEQDHILDLFCGLGNFTLPLAQRAAHVTGVEGSQAMVERGYENAVANGISNVEFFAADLTKDLAASQWAQKNYNKVLLDPPRSGALEILPLLNKIKPHMILYVSCNPATLARDCGVLVNEYGYRLTDAGIMDMFPHTVHVEAMALLVSPTT